MWMTSIKMEGRWREVTQNSWYTRFCVHRIRGTLDSVYTEFCVRESCDVDPTHNFVHHEKSFFPDEKEMLK